MTSHHVITFYSIERIENNKKLGRVVERFCIKNKIVGTFFSTPQELIQHYLEQRTL
jgi:hypothetical protein